MAAHARKNRGFTLIETLVVVGVIAVLAAVSLPLFMDAIEKAHIAADEAYERAALAKAQSMYATDTVNHSVHGYVYFPETDSMIDLTTVYDEYGAIFPSYGQCSQHKDGCIMLRIKDDGEIKFMWMAAEITTHYEEFFDFIN